MPGLLGRPTARSRTRRWTRASERTSSRRDGQGRRDAQGGPGSVELVGRRLRPDGPDGIEVPELGVEHGRDLVLGPG